MKINYVKRVNKGYYSRYSYAIKNVELCCENIKNDLVDNLINMSEHSPYEYREYYLGLVKDRYRKLIKFCPHCGKPIILNKLEDEIYNETDYHKAEKIGYWDKFHPYDFNEGQRFYNCKYEG